MPMRLRTQTTRPAAGPGRDRACAAGLLLAGVARSFEEPESRSRRPPSRPRPVARRGPAAGRRRPTWPTTPARARARARRGIEAAADYIAVVFKEPGSSPPRAPTATSSRSRSAASPTLGKRPELAFNGPGGQGDRRPSQGATSPRWPSASARRSTASRRLRRLRDHGQGRVEEARLRRLRRARRQGQGRPDPPPRAAARRREEPVRRQADQPTSPPSTTRRPTPSSTARRPSCWSTTRPALKGKKDELLRFDDAGPEPYSPIPFVMLTRELADKLLAAAGQPTLGDAREADRRRPQAPLARARGLDARRPGRRSIARRSRPRTSSASSKGSGPHADETVVVGAHYDHLGHGGLLLGLARLPLEGHPQRRRRQRLGHGDGPRAGPPPGARAPTPCPAGSSSWRSRARRRGLLGSQHYVEHPLYPARHRRS